MDTTLATNGANECCNMWTVISGIVTGGGLGGNRLGALPTSYVGVAAHDTPGGQSKPNVSWIAQNAAALPFIERKKIREIRWVKPKVVVEVAFNEITVHGHLRHSKFLRLRGRENLR